MSKIEDIIIKIFEVAAIIILLFLIALIVNIMIYTPQAKKCVRDGGEPYYFITSFECKNNININLKDSE